MSRDLERDIPPTGVEAKPPPITWAAKVLANGNIANSRFSKIQNGFLSHSHSSNARQINDERFSSRL
jgi:hypothetical protein